MCRLKIYKTYFSKEDTPYNSMSQPKRKYHVVWKRANYAVFLGHKPIKVLLFGIFPLKNRINNIKELEKIVQEGIDLVNEANQKLEELALKEKEKGENNEL